jgi:hypothetical protein
MTARHEINFRGRTVQRFLDVILRRTVDDPAIPNCPSHHVDMLLRGKMGRPARFADQTEEEYVLVYFCPVPNCGETILLNRKKAQIPVPGESPKRPSFSRVD